ncbi:MAG TPA: choice-of-anchor J domain-containing protein, partial [Ignavibacteriales bacterium]|nr:choice-of-anchor J domain-containing protein [Ignavibacteriales bacterium]
MKVKITLFLLAFTLSASAFFPQSGSVARGVKSGELNESLKTVSGGAAKTAAYTPGNYYLESFEDTVFPPAGWQTKHISGDGGWMRYAYNPHSGSNVAFIYYETGGIDWLITPQYSAYAGDSLNFYISRYFNSVDTLWVLVSSIAAVPSNEASLNAAFTDTLFVVNKNMLTDNTWRQYSASLDKYAGQQIYIGFKCYNNIGTGLMLDDVALGHHLAADVSPESLSIKRYVSEGVPVNINGSIANLSLSGGAQTFPVTCEILDGSYTDVQTVSDLAPGTSTSVTFAQWTPAVPGTYTVKLYTGLAADGNINNDTITSQVTVLEAYSGLGWHYEADMPVSRNDLAAVSYVKKSDDQAIADTPSVFVLGGRGAPGNTNRMDTTVYKYNAISRSWSNANAKFPEVKNFKAWQFEGKIYVPGGSGADEFATSNLYIYDIEADTVLKGTEMPAATQGYAMGTYGDSLIYVMGGIAGG